MKSANGASSASGTFKSRRISVPLSFQITGFEPQVPNIWHPVPNDSNKDGHQSQAKRSIFLRSLNSSHSIPHHLETSSRAVCNHTGEVKDCEYHGAFEKASEVHNEHIETINPHAFPTVVENSFQNGTHSEIEEGQVEKESVLEGQLEAITVIKSRIKLRSGNERNERTAQKIQSKKYHKEQEILSKVKTEAEIKKAQDQALRYVMVAERDRQRILRSSSLNSENEYTILEQSPPYHEHLNYSLDLVSYDERFSPVLRVNCQLVSGDYELAQAIAKFADFKILPEGTDLWCISHIDDRDFENLIPLLIQMTENNTVAQS